MGRSCVTTGRDQGHGHKPRGAWCQELEDAGRTLPGASEGARPSDTG